MKRIPLSERSGRESRAEPSARSPELPRPGESPPRARGAGADGGAGGAAAAGKVKRLRGKIGSFFSSQRKKGRPPPESSREEGEGDAQRLPRLRLAELSGL